jgi:hypothetical protein
MAIQGTRLVVPRAHEVVAEAFDVPAPGPGQLLLETEASLVSAGTELAIFTEKLYQLFLPRAAAPPRTESSALAPRPARSAGRRRSPGATAR